MAIKQPKKSITGKQRAARKRNIKIARSHKKKSSGAKQKTKWVRTIGPDGRNQWRKHIVSESSAKKVKVEKQHTAQRLGVPSLAMHGYGRKKKKKIWRPHSPF